MSQSLLFVLRFIIFSCFRFSWSNFVSEFVFKGPNVIEGYCYQGAFFSPYQFACMKERYDSELLCYDTACKRMCGTTKLLAKPPTDLPSLKAFLEIGRRGRDRKKGRNRYIQLQTEVDRMARHIKNMMETKISDGHKGCIAPRGVILYFEGLDCAGKSSTGGLVQQALERAGFDVGMRQYNRPPTPEQRLRPWMDRFDKPEILASHSHESKTGDEHKKNCEGHTHCALVWDRGPAGRFILIMFAFCFVESILTIVVFLFFEKAISCTGLWRTQSLSLNLKDTENFKNLMLSVDVKVFSSANYSL